MITQGDHAAEQRPYESVGERACARHPSAGGSAPGTREAPRRYRRSCSGRRWRSRLCSSRSWPRRRAPNTGRTRPGGLIPNDTGIPGQGGAPGDWVPAQWNFTGPFGVRAPQAWANVAADGAPGGKGVIVAVLDTGVAYTNQGALPPLTGLQPVGVRAGL